MMMVEVEDPVDTKNNLGLRLESKYNNFDNSEIGFQGSGSGPKFKIREIRIQIELPLIIALFTVHKVNKRQNESTAIMSRTLFAF